MKKFRFTNPVRVTFGRGTLSEIDRLIGNRKALLVTTPGAVSRGLADKVTAFTEIARVLKPGGRLYLADIIMNQELDEGTRGDVDLWTS